MLFPMPKVGHPIMVFLVLLPNAPINTAMHEMIYVKRRHAEAGGGKKCTCI
jgi:hypothetical protein